MLVAEYPPISRNSQMLAQHLSWKRRGLTLIWKLYFIKERKRKEGREKGLRRRKKGGEAGGS